MVKDFVKFKKYNLQSLASPESQRTDTATSSTDRNKISAVDDVPLSDSQELAPSSSTSCTEVRPVPESMQNEAKEDKN